MSESRANFLMTKMQATGNSFLMTSESVPLKQRATLAKDLCNVNFGIGADGMVFLSFEKSGKFEWDFYNSDGSAAEFCGNAARCAALSIFEKHPRQKKIEINTRAGMVCCEIKNSHTVEVQMPKVEWLSKSLIVPQWPNPVVWINTGVPHVVIEVQSPDELRKYKAEAAHIRGWNQLGPGGANVTFVFVTSEKEILAISYERGVEDFTLACGTGAVAAASFVMARSSTTECQVQMPGGSLEVSLLNGRVFMKGEAYKIAELAIAPSSIKKGHR